jgi:hypothetical protein
VIDYTESNLNRAHSGRPCSVKVLATADFNKGKTPLNINDKKKK